MRKIKEAEEITITALASIKFNAKNFDSIEEAANSFVNNSFDYDSHKGRISPFGFISICVITYHEISRGLVKIMGKDICKAFVKALTNKAISILNNKDNDFSDCKETKEVIYENIVKEYHDMCDWIDETKGDVPKNPIEDEDCDNCNARDVCILFALFGHLKTKKDTDSKDKDDFSFV